jgi:hypothetical protein
MPAGLHGPTRPAIVGGIASMSNRTHDWAEVNLSTGPISAISIGLDGRMHSRNMRTADRP